MQRGGLWCARLFAPHCGVLPLPWFEQPSEPPFASSRRLCGARFDVPTGKLRYGRRRTSLRAEAPCAWLENGQGSFAALPSCPAGLFGLAGKALSGRPFAPSTNL
jgi:hypothetical protein